MTQRKMTECSDQQYRESDARLNALYKRVTGLIAKNVVSAQHTKDADQKRYQEIMLQKLRAAEQAWIHYRDLHCDAARHRYEGGSISLMAWP
jgi:uncharacterized protein YecT (DUF1311 family)